ncbi:MAG TPA: NUDIX domain-containing protein [Solirubrobacteraceae bacterium]|nr:NUDIX domain-containing protein [Solirubrobacteraceae bacterium]
MRVKVRAVILLGDKLVVSRERRQGQEHILLPGGRVQDGESIVEALVREVAEETGLDVAPHRLIYVAEVVGSYGVHDVNLVWLAHPRDGSAIQNGALVELGSTDAMSIMPPIIEQIRADAAAGWPEQPRWLGNLRFSPQDRASRAVRTEQSSQSGSDQQ